MSSWPTAHSFASEHSNFLCTSNTPLVDMQLPCKSPWDDWQSPLQDEFIITAWWPPTMNVIHQYAAAHFNMVMGGNVAQGCQYNGTMRMGASYSEAFECATSFLPLFAELGLKAIPCPWHAPPPPPNIVAHASSIVSIFTCQTRSLLRQVLFVFFGRLH